MTLACANPKCDSKAPTPPLGKAPNTRPVENRGNLVYWLCPECTERFELLFHGDSVAVVARKYVKAT